MIISIKLPFISIQSYLDTLNEKESHLKAIGKELILRKSKCARRMQKLHANLREREHVICMDIWILKLQERNHRRAFQRLADQVFKAKEVLQKTRKQSFWKQSVSYQHYSGIILKYWTNCEMSLTGEHIAITEIKDNVETGYMVEGESTKVRGALCLIKL
jgi:hypothetical protein